MEIARYPSACLPLAFALLLCLAVSTGHRYTTCYVFSFNFKFNLLHTSELYVSHHAESQYYGHGGNQDQIRVKDMWCICDWTIALHHPFIYLFPLS